MQPILALCIAVSGCAVEVGQLGKSEVECEECSSKSQAMIDGTALTRDLADGSTQTARSGAVLGSLYPSSYFPGAEAPPPWHEDAPDLSQYEVELPGLGDVNGLTGAHYTDEGYPDNLQDVEAAFDAQTLTHVDVVLVYDENYEAHIQQRNDASRDDCTGSAENIVDGQPLHRNAEREAVWTVWRANRHLMGVDNYLGSTANGEFAGKTQLFADNPNNNQDHGENGAFWDSQDCHRRNGAQHADLAELPLWGQEYYNTSLRLHVRDVHRVEASSLGEEHLTGSNLLAAIKDNTSDQFPEIRAQLLGEGPYATAALLVVLSRDVPGIEAGRASFGNACERRDDPGWYVTLSGGDANVLVHEVLHTFGATHAKAPSGAEWSPDFSLGERVVSAAETGAWIDPYESQHKGGEFDGENDHISTTSIMNKTARNLVAPRTQFEVYRHLNGVEDNVCGHSEAGSPDSCENGERDNDELYTDCGWACDSDCGERSTNIMKLSRTRLDEGEIPRVAVHWWRRHRNDKIVLRDAGGAYLGAATVGRTRRFRREKVVVSSALAAPESCFGRCQLDYYHKTLFGYRHESTLYYEVSGDQEGVN